MLIDVVMPQMGESLAEGTVVRWLKKAGERVELDEPLFELSTDKVDTDVPSSAAGVLKSIFVAEGQTVAVGARVAVIDDGAATATRQEQAASASMAAPAAEQRTDEPGAHFKNAHAPQLVSFRREAAPTAPPRTERVPRMTAAEKATFSPAVLDAARQGRVSFAALTTMPGSGRGGRVTKSDVARFIASGGAAEGRPPSDVDSLQPSTIPAAYIYRPNADDQVVPMSPARRKIADHMSWSVRISPHASAFADCDMTAAVDHVRRNRDAFAERAGAALTFTAIAAAALARTVRAFPAFNTSVVGDAIVLKPRINLGIAVALPDTDELIVPVVRDADGLSLAGLARAIADVSSRARERRLRPEDVQGGTITLTNPGMFGGITGTPILNQPQVAIIGLGAIQKRAVVLDGDRIAARSMMTIGLTFDHRAADGVAAFKFLADLKARLEDGLDDL
jgi:pyruvate/2-oxoglutarate dehydrogenase complex dihydrolipoamide acyltransferase (E2) component